MGDKEIAFIFLKRAFLGPVLGIRTTSLRERRIWRQWYTFSGWRLLGSCLTALVLLSTLILGILSFETRTGHASEVVLSQAVSKTPSPQKQTGSSDFHKMAKEFAEQRKVAAKGQWLLYTGNPILIRGELEEWDDFKVGSPVVFKEGNSYRMWYRGCHFMGSEYTCGIGHAVSEDGVFWKKSREPVISPRDPIESKRLKTVAIIRARDQYMMWYSVSADWLKERPATVYLATSKDGLNWQAAGSVLEPISEGTTSVEHTAFYDGKVFHLWYIDIPSSDGAKALVHVTSPEGREWQIAGWTPIKTLGTDPGRLCVLSDGRGGYRGFFGYSHREQKEKGFFGILTSSDGNAWQRLDEGTKAISKTLAKDIVPDAPAVLSEPGGLWVWFVLRPENGAEAIGVAYRKGEMP